MAQTRCHPYRTPPAWRAAAVLAAAAALGLSALTGCNRHDALAAGAQQMQQGNYPAAVIEYRNAVEEQPKSVEARVALADALERVNDVAGTENQLRKALEAGGDENLLVPRIAFLMLERNDTEKLIRDFGERKLGAPDADSDLRAIVALAQVSQRRVPLAAAQLKDVQETPTVALARAQLLLAEGKRADALKLLAAAPPNDKTPWWILRATGRLAVINGDNTLAQDRARRAKDAAPWNNALQGEYGESLLAAGKVDEARAVRDRLKKTAPRYFWTRYLDASLLALDGRTDESLAAALTVLEAVPDHLPATLIAARAELQRGDVQAATKHLTAITAKYPSSLPALTLLAQAQLRGNRPQEAADTIRRGLVQAPDNAQLLSLRADLETAAGKRKEAMATLNAILARHPEDGATLLRLAELKAGIGDKAGAAQALDQAERFVGNDALLRDRIVATAIRLRDLPHARRLAELGIAALPNDPQVRLTLAAVQAAQKDNAGAWSSTLAALEAKSTYQPALSVLATMARKPDERSQVLARYARAVADKSQQPQTYLDYARLLRKQPAGTRRDEPLAVLEKGVATLPGSVALREALIDQYMRAGQPDKALSAAQAIASAADATPQAQALLAATYRRLGKTEQAIAAYRKAVTTAPQRTDWRLDLARLEAAGGHHSEAVTLLRGLITSRPYDGEAYVALAQLVAPTSPAEAQSVARQMSSRDDLKLPGMILEGDVLVMMQKYDDALQQYGTAERAGALPVAMLRAAGTLDRAGRGRDAESLAAGALRQYPKNVEVLSFAAQRAIAAGQPAKGVALLQRIVDADPQNPIALNDLAWAQVQAGQPVAVETARKAAALLPDNANVLDTLGVALRLAGRHDEAVATLRDASNLQPGMVQVRLHLAQALADAGDRKGAAVQVAAVKADRLAASDQTALAGLKATLER